MIYRILFRDGTALSLDAADEFGAARIAKERKERGTSNAIWRVEDEAGRVVLGEGYENPPEGTP